MNVAGLSTGLLTILVLLGVCQCQFEWQQEDIFDRVQRQVNRVSADNCQLLRTNDLFLNNDTVSHLPNSKSIRLNEIFPNRTHLVYLHNLVLGRAFFFSFVLQSHSRRSSGTGAGGGGGSEQDPGMMYYFLSAAADISSSPFINSSAVYFAPNTAYSPSFASNFNLTFPLFAPRAFRADDYNSQFHLERTSTMNTISISDLGAISADRLSLNYTNDRYRINEWYKKWLPDKTQSLTSKTAYSVLVRYANDVNTTHLFNGPLAYKDTPRPVNWVRPYFDCGRSNKWVTGAVSPVVDKYHRHTGFRHIEYPTYTGSVAIEMDFERIDINQCSTDRNRHGPNAFSGTNRCPQPTTECEPLDGYGFRRGGYECRCRRGYRLPRLVRRPFLGEMVERATKTDREQHYQCERIGLLQDQINQIGKQMDAGKRAKYISQGLGNSAASAKADDLDELAERQGKQPRGNNIRRLKAFMNRVNADNCRSMKKSDLVLRDDAMYGAEKQFQWHARMALRLANFISSFLQVSDSSEGFTDSRLPDPFLTEDQMIGEVLSIVMGDYMLLSAGMYWDRGQFANRTLFAPYAFSSSETSFTVDDLARKAKFGENYLDDPLFRKVKSRWSTNFESLDKTWLQMQFRSGARGEKIVLKKYTRFPEYFRAARLEHGVWSSPYFDCYGNKPEWMITYAAPFFGWDRLKYSLEFKGMVAVSMTYEKLSLNQCDQDFFEQNAFKNTHKCNRRSTYCVPSFERELRSGSYRCECQQGYEFPFSGRLRNYYDGDEVELNFNRMVENKSNIFDYLTCRLAGASTTSVSQYLLIISHVLTCLLSVTSVFRLFYHC